MSEIIIEKLLERRDNHLNTLKQLEFQLIIDLSEKEKLEMCKLQSVTVEQLKKIEQEIAFLLSKESA